jgi:hypothetical protein
MMVEVTIVIPSLVRADLYALLLCGEDSKYGRKVYDDYFEVFCVLLAKYGKSSPLASGNF